MPTHVEFVREYPDEFVIVDRVHCFTCIQKRLGHQERGREEVRFDLFNVSGQRRLLIPEVDAVAAVDVLAYAFMQKEVPELVCDGEPLPRPAVGRVDTDYSGIAITDKKSGHVVQITPPDRDPVITDQTLDRNRRPAHSLS